jgi:hypothetical protein
MLRDHQLGDMRKGTFNSFPKYMRQKFDFHFYKQLLFITKLI